MVNNFVKTQFHQIIWVVLIFHKDTYYLRPVLKLDGWSSSKIKFILYTPTFLSNWNKGGSGYILMTQHLL